MRILHASVLVILSLATANARAQPSALERARVLFEEGRTAYEAGDFETALERFRDAHAITDSPDILYNVATAADRLRRDEVALEAYRGYLEARPASEDRAQVEARIRVLEEQVARREEERRRQEAEREALAAQIEARAASGDAGPAPWIVAGVGGAALVAGVIAIVVAELDAACVEAPAGCVAQPDSPRWSEVAERYDRVPVLRAVGGALTGVGVAALAVGVVWGVVASGGGSEAPAAELQVGPTGVRVRGRF